MRLLVFLTWDVSLKLWDEKGLLQREMKLYQKLAQQNIEVVILSWGGQRDEEIARDYQEITVVPVYKNLLKFNNSKVLRGMSSLLLPFRLKRYMNDMTVFKTNQMLGGWSAVIAKYLYRRPLLVRTGYEYYDFTLRGNYGMSRRFFAWAISWLTYRSADHVFLASPADKNFVIDRFSLKAEKITVCPNWIDTDLFSPDHSVTRTDKLLFVGRLNQQKNLPALIEAVAGTPYTLEIIGNGELKEELKNHAEKIKAKVVFLGSIANDLLPQKYRECGLYILPSFYEGNPKTLLEAMACEAPVLGANVPGIKEVIIDGKDGILSETDASSLNATIIRTMSVQMDKKALGYEARKAILANNTLAAQVVREVKLLQDLNSPPIHK